MEIEKKGAIKYGDLIILYEGGDSIKYFTLEKGKAFQNRFGAFKNGCLFYPSEKNML